MEKLQRFKDGEVEVNGKKYVIRELASQEMKISAGAHGMQQQLVTQSEHGLLLWRFYRFSCI